MKCVLRNLGFLFFLTGTLALTTLHAKSQNTSAPKGPDLDKTLLWKIKGNGLEKPSYLFGTMHLLCEEDAFISEQLQQVIADCDTVFFEIDLDDMKQMLSALKHLQMKDGVQLSDLLTEDEYKRLQEYFRTNKLPIPFSFVKRFKPFLLSALMSEQVMECPSKDGMEQVIMAEAKKFRKPIKGLETIAFQASIFDSIPYKDQAKELMNYLDSSEQYAASTRKMIEVYRRQDLAQMEQLVRASDPGMEKYMDLLLYGRNRRWSLQMKSLIPNASCLFAVGAGHLPGKEGMIQLIRKLGYEVTPVVNTQVKSL